MHILHSVKGELIFPTPVVVKPFTDLIIQVERIAENAPCDAFFFQKIRQFPKITVQYRITARDVKIGSPSELVAHSLAAFDHLLHLLPRHFRECLAIVLSKNITVLAPLVAGVGDVPLESKIRFHLGVLQSM